MTKAVLFDFDETLQDRTAAFEKYMDTFLDTYSTSISTIGDTINLRDRQFDISV